MTFFIETVGWLGALLILLAYALLSTGRIEGRSRTYQWLNLFGAVGFIVNSSWNGAWPSAALNVVWLAIGAVTLWRLGRGRQSR
ncbi:MAG: hypothetical protein RLZZ200_3121 [Pseudomonadota bacterium]|jgi:hypothetical protein